MSLPIVIGFLALDEMGQNGFESVFEQIGHRPELDGALGLQRLRGGPGAASPAANKGNLDRLVACRVSGACDGTAQHRAGQSHCAGVCQRSRQRLAAGEFLRFVFGHRVFSLTRLWDFRDT